MTVLSALSGCRRSLVAVLAASAVTAGLAGADLVSGAGRAEARVVPAAQQATAATGTGLGTVLGTVPVSVPASVRFRLDIVAVAMTPEVRSASPGSVRDIAAATLAGLPASAGVALRFDDPRLGRHLGGVFMDAPGTILVGATALAGDTSRTADVVRHEMAHVYQARLMTTLSFEAVDDRMVQVFGPDGLERAADCVALALGAGWTHYTSDCGGPGKAAAVEALIGGRMP